MSPALFILEQHVETCGQLLPKTQKRLSFWINLLTPHSILVFIRLKARHLSHYDSSVSGRIDQLFQKKWD